MAVSKQKGAVAEAKVLSYLISKGYQVFVPWGEDHRFDLLCEINGCFKRIQVKYVTPKNAGIDVPLRSANNWSTIRYTPKNVDLIAAYNPENDKIYFIDLKDYPNIATLKLRLEKTRNLQKKNVKWAEEFEALSLPA
jgi:hypothetical protein